MTAADARSEKLRLRRVMQSRLGEVTSAEARAAGASIAHRLDRWAPWREAARVGVFAARPDEVDTSILIEGALRAGKQVLFPRTTQAAGLEFASVSNSSQLLMGRFGIPEPDPDSPVTGLDSVMLLLLPGLAFDREGGRLGRGGGYYDRALDGLRDREHCPTLIGVGFGFQLVERVPMTSLDIRVDGVVSEDELIETDAYRLRRERAGR